MLIICVGVSNFMRDKIKTTSFWLGIGSAIIIIISCLSKLFGFEICADQIENVIISICSLLVMLGIITKKKTSDVGEIDKNELISDIENFKTDDK